MTETSPAVSASLSRLAPDLRCPACGGRVTAAPAEVVCSACLAAFPVRDGVPDLIHPAALAERDERWQADYDQMAEKYDEMTKTLTLWLECDWEEDRRRVAARLGLEPGQTVLEVSVGTGANLPYLAEGLTGRGRIVALDLSPGMLAVARKKVQAPGFLGGDAAVGGGLTVDFLLANGSYLPFAPASFDAVLHVGGINEFAERRRAFAEMVRVARPGGRVVVCDEGIPLWHQDSPRGRRLIDSNSLYRHEPPFEDVPWAEIEDFHLDWIGNEVFWVISFGKKD